MFFSIGFFVYWSAAGTKILARRRRKKNCGQNTPKLRKHLRTSALPQFWPFFPYALSYEANLIQRFYPVPCHDGEVGGVVWTPTDFRT